jgi:NAD(P)-dependent dehydrogenase (short-subunit alcohol dehydrogenase family)
MVRLEETIEVQRSIQDCFRYLLDFSTIEQWDPGVYRAKKVTPGKPCVGSVFELILNSGGNRIPMTYRLEALDAPHRLVLRGTADTVVAVDTITLKAIDPEKTEIQYVAELSFRGALQKAEPLLRPWLNGVGKRAVAGMREALNIPSTISEETWSDRFKERLILPGAWDFSERGYLQMSRKALAEFADGKTVVITGPTSGLGLAAAYELARLGASLVLVGRNLMRLQKAKEEIQELSGCGSECVKIYEGELTHKSELRRLGKTIRENHPKIDAVIHNAGALFSTREVTPEGYEKTFAIHLLAPWILTEELLPSLEAARGRVILVSSGGMYTQPLPRNDWQSEKTPFDGTQTYARMKRAQIILTENWANEWRQKGMGVEAFSMHPGWAATPGVSKSLPRFEAQLRRHLRDPRMGADTAVWLVTTAAVAGHSGTFWFDRKPRPTVLLPGTRPAPEAVRACLEELQKAARAS